ncbi:unnamed protein product, partial [Medioppia subpectinata]
MDGGGQVIGAEVGNIEHSLVKRSLASGGTITFPKTKWCGPGRTARHYDDLGADVDTDSCCRDHDNCQPRGLYPGQLQRYCNVRGSRFQISACECDQQFKQCLSNIPLSISARMVAKIYRIFVTQCIDYNQYTRDCNVIDRSTHDFPYTQK